MTSLIPSRPLQLRYLSAFTALIVAVAVPSSRAGSTDNVDASATIAAADPAQLLVPMYDYPTPGSALWNGVRDAALSVPITAIVNPANGPGTSVDANYTTRINELQQRGVTLAGYVHTSYGTRALTVVMADIDAYRTLYPQVTTIFVDEQSADPAYLNYYQSLYDYVALRGFTRVFTNPGTQTPESFTLSSSVPVTTVLYESTLTGWINYATPAYVASRPATDFAAMVIGVGTATKMRQCLDLAKARNIGCVYVTPDKGGNPYDTLPSYWTEEVVAATAP